MTDETPQTEAEAPPEEAMVPIPEATDEDIEAFLKAEETLESAQEEPPEAPPKKAPPPKAEAKAKDAEPKPEAPAPEQAKKPTPAEVQARAVGLVRQVEGQEHLLRNQISRLAEFKKDLQAKIEKLADGLDDKYIEQPRVAFKDEMAIKEAQDTIGLIDQETAKLEKKGQAQKVLSAHIKPEEWFPNDALAALVEDGVSQEQAQAFINNPFAFNADPAFLIQLQRRARAEHALRIIAPLFEQMKAENAELKSRLEQAPSKVLKRIESAAATPPRVNGRAAGRTAKQPNFEDPSTLSDAELEELLRNES